MRKVYSCYKIKIFFILPAWPRKLEEFPVLRIAIKQPWVDGSRRRRIARKPHWWSLRRTWLQPPPPPTSANAASSHSLVIIRYTRNRDKEKSSDQYLNNRSYGTERQVNPRSSWAYCAVFLEELEQCSLWLEARSDEGTMVSFTPTSTTLFFFKLKISLVYPELIIYVF